MVFNDINYGSIESFASHSTLHPKTILYLVAQSNNNQALFEQLVCKELKVKYTNSVLFYRGQVFKTKRDIAYLFRMSLTNFVDLTNMGKTIDEIVIWSQSSNIS